MIAQFEHLLQWVFSSFWIFVGCWMLLGAFKPFYGMIKQVSNLGIMDKLIAAFKEVATENSKVEYEDDEEPLLETKKEESKPIL